MSFSISGSQYQSIQTKTGAAVKLFSDNDGSTGLIAQNGDSISYDPSVQTSHSGLQAALTAHVGSETLAQFQSGAAAVSDSQSGTTIALDKGRLYASPTGSSERVDLGAAATPEAWSKAQAALGGGDRAAAMLGDLEKAGTLGITSAPTVQQHAPEFGQTNQAGLDELIKLLEQDSAGGNRQIQSKPDPLAILADVRRQLGIDGSAGGPNGQAQSPQVDPETLAAIIAIALLLGGNQSTNSGLLA